MERKKLLLLNPKEYEHEFDRAALETLEGTPGLEKLARKFNKHAVERYFRLMYTGSYLKVNENNFPDVYQKLEEACANLYVKHLPELYIQWDYSINGFTTGSEKPLVVLTSGAVDLLSPDELLYLIGHEVGHIKSGHMLYHEMAIVLPFLGDIIGSATLGIGSLVSTGVELSLLYWYRMSELTADRAGLLACQNPDAAYSALMKMAGVPKNFFEKINQDDFIQQARDFKSFDYNAMDKIGKTILISVQDHPWTVMRASELLKWVESERYEKLLELHGKDNLEELEISCQKCGHKLKGNETFCGVCGSKVWKR
ncbi:protease [Methanobacterium sp. CWC-01]|uniref:M48 family metallopeptidase n=1 Tax=Methanobacterium aridiramus TaxID=2584467 RepID=UPI002574EBC4|nr:M48 family metallopeptidase [Methanobacterium sp. CWC-01]WJI10452.1 protease [Methanobacterium sp. CWC-01]